jgi:uncharacterized protein
MREVRFALAAVLLLCVENFAAMIAPEQVFTDPKVIALAKAAAAGDAGEVRRLIAAGADAKAKGRKGLTLPHFALYAKQRGAEVVRLLIRAGADPVSRLEDGHDVPHYAAARDHADPDFLAVLLDAGVSPDLIGGGEKNSLLDAAVSGRNAAVVQLLLARGANVNYNHPFDGTALHTAVRIADYAMAALLLEHGADPHLRDHQDPKIAPQIPRYTPAELYCRFQSGKRNPPTSEQLAGFEEMKRAFARRGVVLPCGI